VSRDKERDPKGKAEWAYRFDESRRLDAQLVSRSVERIAQSRTLLERTEPTVRTPSEELLRRAQAYREMADRIRTLARHLAIADDRERLATYAADIEQAAEQLEREAARSAS
jgi:hypothetical protein